MGQQHQSGVAEPRPAGMAHQQGQALLFLQFAQGPGDGRLGQAEATGGRANPAAVGDGDGDQGL
ncbi:hypothetical protein D3C78_1507270 [compost metagenome]